MFKLTRKDVTFLWTEELEKAFREIKNALIRAPILIYPDFNKPFEIYSDASNTAIGAVLVQQIDDKIHPVAYASRLLNKNELNYSTSEKEMLAIVWASKHFKSFIYGRHTIFRTDHKPLSTLVKSKEPDGRLNSLMVSYKIWTTKSYTTPAPKKTILLTYFRDHQPLSR